VAILVYTGRVPHTRGAAHSLRGQHDDFKSGALFPQVLSVVNFAIKHCVSNPPNTFIVMHRLEVYYFPGLTHWGGSVLFMRPLCIYRVGKASAILTACLFRWVRPILWRGSIAVGPETLRIGGKILPTLQKRSNAK
jgi:hypothetical protein